MKAQNLTGKRIGKLLVIKEAYRDVKRGIYWECKCDCGEVRNNLTSTLNRKNAPKSCGCEKKAQHLKTHGESKTKFYLIWHRIRQRCNYKKHQRYKTYGGRGIKICKKWDDYLAFKKDMYDSYLIHIKKYGEDETTIDRIDPNGNYQPSNCRWATKKEQANNRRNNVYITYEGETLTVKEWSEKLGINYQTLYWRIVVKKLKPLNAFKK